MSEAFELLDENSGFVQEVPLIIPLRWRIKTTTSVVLGGTAFNFANFSGPGAFLYPTTTITYGSWTDGGSVLPSRQVCKYTNGSGFLARRVFATIPNPDAFGNPYVHFSTDLGYVFTDINVEIDWEYTLNTLRTSYNPKFYAIGVIRFTDITGATPLDLVKEGLVELAPINSVFRDTTHIGEIVSKDLLQMTTLMGYTDNLTGYGPGYPDGDLTFKNFDSVTVNGISGDIFGAGFNQQVQDMLVGAVNTCVSNSRLLNMYLKVWIKFVVGASGGLSTPEATQQQLKDDDASTLDPEQRLSNSGVGMSGSGLGSSSQGLNGLITLNGNSNLPFDSVFLTGNNYNSFVSAGGGVISESGVFPNSASFYIDIIRLSIEGSTMSVVEVVKFDSTPSLTIGQKIYGYAFDDNNQNKPVFTGYVISYKRKLGADTQDIIYECRDFSYYLAQFYSPSYYIYQPPASGGSKTYDRVLKEVLNIAGIPDTIISIPELPAPPVDWIYEPISNILEWATKYFGKYVSYIDRYGRLNIRATDSGSFIKNLPIPVEGTPVSSGDYKIISNEPIVDYSRSRSKIILTGDFSLRETTYTGRHRSRGPINPNNANTTGFYWYYQSINAFGGTSRFFYFVFKTSQQLLENLLSDPNKSAVVKMTYTTQLGGAGGVGGTGTQDFTIDMPIIGFFTGIGGGKIVAQFDRSKILSGQPYPMELGTSPFVSGGGAVVGNVDYTFTVQYAMKDREPMQVFVNTGLIGGVEVVKRPEFKKISGFGGGRNDEPLMQSYLSQIQEFYKPIFGGKLQKDSLDLDLELLGKVSITGTTLPSVESDNLIIYEIEYNIPKKITTLDLSNKVYEDLPFFDPIRERGRRSGETNTKIALIEQKSIYNTQ